MSVAFRRINEKQVSASFRFLLQSALALLAVQAVQAAVGVRPGML